MRIGTIAGGVGVATTFNLTYVPQFLAYVASVQLQSLKVDVLGEGTILDLDTVGLNSLGRLGLQGLPANGWEFALADGKILEKTVIVTAVNGATGAINLYASGEAVGSGYIRSLRTRVFANTNMSISNFYALALPNMAPNDALTISFEDGLIEILNRQDLEFRLARVQNTIQAGLLVNDFTIDNVQVLVAGDQNAYIVDFQRETPRGVAN